MAFASSVFPTPAGPSTSSGFSSAPERYTVVAVALSARYPSSASRFSASSGDSNHVITPATLCAGGGGVRPPSGSEGAGDLVLRLLDRRLLRGSADQRHDLVVALTSCTGTQYVPDRREGAEPQAEGPLAPGLVDALPHVTDRPGDVHRRRADGLPGLGRDRRCVAGSVARLGGEVAGVVERLGAGLEPLTGCDRGVRGHDRLCRGGG